MLLFMKKRFLQITLLLILPVFLTWGLWISPVTALTTEQSLLAEAWRIVNLAYVDDSFNHQQIECGVLLVLLWY